MNNPWNAIGEVEVSLNFGSTGEHKIGTLTDAAGGTFFYYDEAFLELEINPAPFDIPYLPEAHQLQFDHQTVLGMFGDSLPEGWARRVLETQLARQGVNWRDLSAVDRFALVGGNNIGALTFRPEHHLAAQIPSLTVEDLARTIIELGADGDAQLNIARKLVGSLGGVRPKAQIWMSNGEVSVIPKESPDQWILKFPNPTYDEPNAGLVEYAYSSMARAAGIRMAPTRLVEHRDGPAYFATARFDKSDGVQFHYQSFAGLYGLAPLTRSTYANLLSTEMQLTAREEPSEQLIRRMAFNVMACVRDDHIRNHGFLMDAEGIWAPAPAFDLTFDDKLDHEMIVGDEVRNPGISDLRRVVEQVGGDIDRANIIFDEVRDSVARWPEFAAEAGLDRPTIQAIQRRLRSISA